MTAKKTKKINLENSATEKLDFEASLKQLETLVSNMEKGLLGLDDSLKTFSEGVVLTQKCQAALKAAEQKVKILSEEKLVDFTGDSKKAINEEEIS